MKTMLKFEFDMKDLGPAKKIFGISIERCKWDGYIFLNQKHYLEKLIENFFMRGPKPTRQPITNQFQLSSQLCPTTNEERVYG